jgi:hypothetical protein
MDQIATKTKLLRWDCIGDKEKIDLEVCDFSPDQVGRLDRLLRAGEKERVRLTIEPEQKKLQLGTIVCPVRLVSLSCRPGGQKLKVSGFHSPDERAITLKRLAANETPILVTIEEIQQGLPFGDDPMAGDGPSNVEPGRTRVSLSPTLSGCKNCSFRLQLWRVPGRGYMTAWIVHLGNRMGDQNFDKVEPERTWTAAIQAAVNAASEWVAALTMQGAVEIRRRERYLKALVAIDWAPLVAASGLDTSDEGPAMDGSPCDENDDGTDKDVV